MNLYSRIAADKRALLITLAIVIIANVLLYIVVVFPLGRQVASAEAEAKLQRELLHAARQDYNAARATVTGKQQADAALEKFYKDVLPTDSSVARKLTYTRLSQLARQANVQLESGQNAVKPQKGSTLAKLTTTYTLTGDYRNVRRFIYSLETAPEFIVLENVALTSPGEQQARGLSVKLDIATYFRSRNVAG
jgi:Tfp pilus assembly protein PilO